MRYDLFVLACCLALSGCGQNPETRTKSDSPSAPNEPLVIAANPPQEPSPPTADSDGNLLRGSNFTSNSFEPPQLLSDGSQLLSHYGATSATVELKSAATRMIAHFKPRPNGDSYPVVHLSALRTSRGPYRSEKILSDEVVRSEDPIVRDVSLEAGTWLISVGNYASSAAERANLEIHSIRFE